MNGVAGANNRLSNYHTVRSREDFTIDTRTATEYGVLRTYFEGVFNWTSGGYSANGTGGTTYADDGVAGGSIGVHYAFIQFAGFTMARETSQFLAPWMNCPGSNFDGLPGSGSWEPRNQFTYTAGVGQAVSASFSAEEKSLVTRPISGT